MKKTEGLSYPSNPLAAMRDLQDLDAPKPAAPTPEAPPHTASQEQRDPDSNIASLQHSNTATQERKSTAKQIGGNERRRASPKEKAPQRGTASVRQAILAALQDPYEPDLEKGPLTTTTMRLPAEVWKRVGMASSVTGKTRQALVTESLIAHLEKLGREEV